MAGWTTAPAASAEVWTAATSASRAWYGAASSKRASPAASAPAVVEPNEARTAAIRSVTARRAASRFRRAPSRVTVASRARWVRYDSAKSWAPSRARLGSPAR